jgi:hypothetical protein
MSSVKANRFVASDRTTSLKGIVMNYGTLARRLLIGAGLVIGATGAFAQSTATATGTATANVIRPITLAAARNLAFGNVVPGASTGTLLVAGDSAGAQTVGGGVTQPGGQKGTVTSAQFNVAGEGAFTYTITIPTAAITISDGGSPADTMTVDTWTSDIATTAGAGLLSGTAGTAGAQTFYVGGTLNVGANQAAGAYTGTFSVTVAYN